MKIHASLITDIPHFYLEWFLNRIKAGYVDIKREKFVERYDFQKNKIEKIFFWSRDISSLLRKYKELKELPYDFEVINEISLYDKCYEPEIKDKSRVLNDIRKASALFGKEKTSFSYGPIFITFNCNIEWHLAQFEFLCKTFKEHVNHVYIDFNTSESCARKNKYNISLLSDEDKASITLRMKDIAKEYGMTLLLKPDPSALPYDEIDLGVMNSCPSGCVYCKGVTNRRTAKINLKTHIPTSSLLLGKIEFDTKIKNVDIEKLNKKNRDTSSLFDF